MAKQRACPECGSVENVRIVYGMPGPELFEAEERGEIALGGCVIGSDDPNRRCVACGNEWSGR
jgi:hypothetical protein